MRGQVALSIVVALTVLVGAAQAQLKCAPGDENDRGISVSTLDENDTLRIVVVFAAGGSDCPAGVDSRNWLIPPWADSLFNPEYAGSVSRYFKDNSRGQLYVTGTVARRHGNDLATPFRCGGLGSILSDLEDSARSHSPFQGPKGRSAGS